MKNFIFGLISLVAFSASAEVSCLRFMGKVDRVIWTKTCSNIVLDDSEVLVDSIDGCLGKYEQNGHTYIVFNSDFQSSNKSYTEALITKVSDAQGFHEDAKNIKASIDTASPELVTRYRHRLDYNKGADLLRVRMAKGLFTLKEKIDLTLQCE